MPFWPPSSFVCLLFVSLRNLISNDCNTSYCLHYHHHYHHHRHINFNIVHCFILFAFLVFYVIFLSITFLITSHRQPTRGISITSHHHRHHNPLLKFIHSSFVLFTFFYILYLALTSFTLPNYFSKTSFCDHSYLFHSPVYQPFPFSSVNVLTMCHLVFS